MDDILSFTRQYIKDGYSDIDLCLEKRRRVGIMNHGIEKEGNLNKERASLSFIYFFNNRRVVALLHVILQLYSLSSILIRNDTIVAIIIIVFYSFYVYHHTKHYYFLS